MALLRIAEIFGFDLADHNPNTQARRVQKNCPFRNSLCTKSGRDNPLGVCSFTDGRRLAVVCPYRFLEDGRVFRDVGRQAFGPGVRITAIPELPILRVGTGKRVGKVDYIIAKVTDKRIVDFAALETQGVYISGRSFRPAFDYFLLHGELPDGSERRPDWRSSAQKRLMPQLSLKVPVFRRWGKKFFIAVDSEFFAALPPISSVEAIDNSEITWLAYPFENKNRKFTIGTPRVVYTTWDDVVSSLREGRAPSPDELVVELERKRQTSNCAEFVT